MTDAEPPAAEASARLKPQASSVTQIGTWSEGFSRVRISASMPQVYQPVGGLRGQQHVVDADAPVLLQRAGLVVPERVDARALVDRPQRVGEAEVDDAAEGRRVGGRKSASLAQTAGPSSPAARG